MEIATKLHYFYQIAKHFADKKHPRTCNTALSMHPISPFSLRPKTAYHQHARNSDRLTGQDSAFLMRGASFAEK